MVPWQDTLKLAAENPSVRSYNVCMSACEKGYLVRQTKKFSARVEHGLPANLCSKGGEASVGVV